MPLPNVAVVPAPVGRTSEYHFDTSLNVPSPLKSQGAELFEIDRTSCDGSTSSSMSPVMFAALRKSNCTCDKNPVPVPENVGSSQPLVRKSIPSTPATF